MIRQIRVDQILITYFYLQPMIQNRRMRAQSAKPYSQRVRPLSSKTPKISQKTGLIQKIYANNIPNLQQRPNSGRQKAKFNSLYLANNLAHIPGGTIQRQALQEENLQLKKKVHLLEQEMAKMHGRMDTFKSKASRANGPLNIEFQNQNLWTKKNAYLVTGVKNQYQNLKAKYKQKCDELNSLKAINIYTNLKQLQKQNDTLKKQNYKLVQNIVELEKKSSIMHNSSELFKGQQGKINELMISELEYNLGSMEEKLTRRNEELSALRQSIQLEHTRVKFLEKLIIQKDNSLHALHIKSKKLEKEKHTLLDEIDQINIKMVQFQNQHDEKIQNVHQIQTQKNSRERKIYIKTIEEKNVLLEKLQKQVAYLTTLLSYWKPLDDDKQQSNPSRENKAESPDRYEEEKRKNTVKVSEALNAQMNSAAQKSTESIPQRKFTEENVMTGPRTQKRADKKRSQQTKKVRRVKDGEVQQIGELIKFRLIAQRVSIQNAKAFLNHMGNAKNTEEQETWEKEYITMRQTDILLKKGPFFLSEDQAHLLSRYMVEDVMNDYIYCDEENENKRQIVKSILKNIVGDYSVEKQAESIIGEMQVELGRYRSKISTILEQMYSGGLISKRKFIEIIVGSGSQIPEDVLDYMIGRIAMKSQTLNTLTYRVLF